MIKTFHRPTQQTAAEAIREGLKAHDLPRDEGATNLPPSLGRGGVFSSTVEIGKTY